MKILLVKLNHIGDTLLLTPTISFLREKYPDAVIDVIVRKGCEGVLTGNPDITNLIPVASPERMNRTFKGSAAEFLRTFKCVFGRRYDYAFDLSNSDRAKLWIILSGAKVRSINDWHADLGIRRAVFNRFTHFEWSMQHQVLRDFNAVADVIEPGAVPGPLYINTDIDAGAVVRRLPFMGTTGRYIIIHPVSRWTFKQWLPERWAELADSLTEKLGYAIVFSSGPDASETSYISDILGRTRLPHHFTGGVLSLRELAYLSKGASLFVGVDTVAMHIAAAVQAPIVALFGPSSEWSWRPWRTRHELVLGDCSCKRTRKFVCDKSKPFPCMEKIAVADVMDAVRRVLDGQ